MLPEWIDVNLLPEPYPDILRLIGREAVLKIIVQYQGQSIYFKANSILEELSLLIGMTNAIILKKNFGTGYVYFPKLDYYIKDCRDKEIFSKFDGGNYAELARDYNLTERWIREIVDRLRKPPASEQIGFL